MSTKKDLICRRKMRFSRHQAKTCYGFGPVLITKRTRKGMDTKEARIRFSFQSCDPSLFWSQCEMSEEELHWLIIAGMKGTLTLWTDRLAAFNAAHYTEGRQLLERGGIYRRAAPWATCQKRPSSAAVQTWPDSSGSKGNSWGVGGGNRVYKNIVSTQSKELSGIYALERLCECGPASSA
ncbi:Hypothetical predicted protein [Lynx pardinus]|uniref:Uncharacterized protein n=1 Tax=Lynx pardinus TaxID=191816 RepID=A0A485NDR8_LYNPA|nr:Hypothetical predicted protein [Lynx pardinus]